MTNNAENDGLHVCGFSPIPLLHFCVRQGEPSRNIVVGMRYCLPECAQCGECAAGR